MGNVASGPACESVVLHDVLLLCCADLLYVVFRVDANMKFDEMPFPYSRACSRFARTQSLPVLPELQSAAAYNPSFPSPSHTAAARAYAALPQSVCGWPRMPNLLARVSVPLYALVVKAPLVVARF